MATETGSIRSEDFVSLCSSGRPSSALSDVEFVQPSTGKVQQGMDQRSQNQGNDQWMSECRHWDVEQNCSPALTSRTVTVTLHDYQAAIAMTKIPSEDPYQSRLDLPVSKKNSGLQLTNQHLSLDALTEAERLSQKARNVLKRQQM